MKSVHLGLPLCQNNDHATVSIMNSGYQLFSIQLKVRTARHDMSLWPVVNICFYISRIDWSVRRDDWWHDYSMSNSLTHDDNIMSKIIFTSSDDDISIENVQKIDFLIFFQFTSNVLTKYLHLILRPVKALR